MPHLQTINPELADAIGRAIAASLGRPMDSYKTLCALFRLMTRGPVTLSQYTAPRWGTQYTVKVGNGEYSAPTLNEALELATDHTDLVR